MKSSLRRDFLPVLLAGGLLVVGLRGGSYDDVARGEAFFVVWWVLGLALAFGLLPRAVPSRPARVAVAALIALAGWTALGALWSESVGRTLHEASRTLGFAGLLLFVLCTFGRETWWRAAAAVTATAILVCCLSFASRMAPLGGALEGALDESGYVTKRLNYPFNYWNAVGIWAAMTVGLALAWSAHAGRWWMRAAALAGVSVAVTVAYLTYSRSAAIGVAIAVVAVVALSRHRWLAALHAVLAAAGSAALILTVRSQPEIAQGSGHGGAGWVLLAVAVAVVGCTLGAYAGSAAHVERARLSPRLTRVVAGLIGVVALVAAIVFAPTVTARAWDSFRERQDVALPADPARRLSGLSGERRLLWDAALDTFRSHPLRGEGAGTYEFVWNQDERWTHHVRDAHSLYLETLAETGLPGALLLVLALGASLAAAVVAPFRQRDPAATGAAAGCAAALLVFCVTAGVDWMWESTAITAAAIACAGLALASGTRRAPQRRAVPRVAGCLLAVMALGLQTPALLAASKVRASQDAIRDRRGHDALVTATDAVKAEPWSTIGVSQRALVLERLGFLDAAAADARRATELETTNAEAWLILARIEVERHRTPQAIAAANRARELNPRNPVFAPSGGS